MSLELICLGVGQGASYIMRGITSTAFALREGDDVLLVDCGSGVALAAQKYLGFVPGRMFITHNHNDHTGDLPSALKFTHTPPHVFGSADVLDLVRDHRLHDSPESHEKLLKKVTWHAANAHGELRLDDRHMMRLFQSQHRYICYGFVLFRDDQPILGYSADSGFNHAIYDRLSAAPVAIVDAREEGNADHASFEQVEQYAAQHPNTRFLCVHYEAGDYGFRQPNVALLHPGETITLLE